jgi:hypothetical protein
MKLRLALASLRFATGAEWDGGTHYRRKGFATWCSSACHGLVSVQGAEAGPAGANPSAPVAVSKARRQCG